MFYVYVLKNTKNTLYIGFTKNLKQRMREHNTATTGYTAHDEWLLVYYEAYFCETEARKRERRLKDGRARSALVKRIEQSIKLRTFK
jgi:putative endonuclease